MNAPTTRRELLKLTPLIALGAFAIPALQEKLLLAGVHFSDIVSQNALGARRHAETFEHAALTPFERFPYNSYDTHEQEIDFATWTLTNVWPATRSRAWRSAAHSYAREARLQIGEVSPFDARY